jgi:hypothetical protein
MAVQNVVPLEFPRALKTRHPDSPQMSKKVNNAKSPPQAIVVPQSKLSFSINEATMPILSKVADCASWSFLTVVLAVSVTVGGVLIYFKHKKLSSLTKNSIEKTRQVLGLQWRQMDFGHEKNDCEHWMGGFVLC